MSVETASTTTTTVARGPKSPKPSGGNDGSPKTSNSQPKSKVSDNSSAAAPVKPEPTIAVVEASKPLAPPPRPGQAGNTPDYFNSGIGDSLSLEPNPFEQSFGAPPETPGGTKLPPVAALTSPSSLLPGSGATPFAWGASSLRTGPLSPAMLSGPTTNDYFTESHHLHRYPPTPNESSLRTGLTPGGSGSMFPAPSPNSQAIFAHIVGGGATPTALDFHRTALSAAAAKRGLAQTQAPQPPVTSQPQELPTGTATKSDVPIKPASGPFDPHDNDAANGLFMLARQGRNGTQPQSEYPLPPAPQQPVNAHPPPIVVQQQQQQRPQPPPLPPQQQVVKTSPQMSPVNGTSGMSHNAASDRGSVGSEEVEQPRPATRGKKRGAGASGAATNGRKKSQDPPAKAPASKKTKNSSGAPVPVERTSPEYEDSDEDGDEEEKSGNAAKGKMTDNEKRKNFLERNRIAALKCRQRKKQWLTNLQVKVEAMSSENDTLQQTISGLREEVVNLKTLLLAHKDCPVTQQQSMHAGYIPAPAIDAYGNPQMHPYGVGAGPIMGQPGMSGPPPMNGQSALAVDRRMS